MSKPGSVCLRKPDGGVKHEEFDHVDPQEGYVFCKDESGERHYYPWHRVEEVKRVPDSDRLLQVNERIEDSQDLGMLASATIAERIVNLVGEPDSLGEFPEPVRVEGTLRIKKP